MTANFSKLPPSSIWGFETEARATAVLAQGNLRYNDRFNLVFLRGEDNAVRVLTYVPGFNVVSGIIKIFYHNHPPEFHSAYVFRGVCEIVAGPLLFIVDIIATIWNEIIARRYIAAFAAEHEGRMPIISLAPLDAISGAPILINPEEGNIIPVSRRINDQVAIRYHLSCYPEVEIPNPTDEQIIRARVTAEGELNFPIPIAEIFKIHRAKKNFARAREAIRTRVPLNE